MARLTDPDNNGIQAIEGLSAAEAQEAEALGDYVIVPVGDIKVHVKPQNEWRMSASRALTNGDLDTFVDLVVHPDDVEDLLDLDITLDEFNEFVRDASKATGDDMGKSKRRSTSSRNTRRK